MENVSEKNYLTTLLLAVFLGVLGGHRFYTGKWGTGIIWLLTGGVFFVGVIYDIVMIGKGEFTDKEGNRVVADHNKPIEIE